ncbi:MAG: hypothetical protein ACI805_001749, partial [Candidatus Azotimanducaceae bacterium]
MNSYPIDASRISWRWWLAVVFFLFSLVGLLAGV